MLRIQLDLNLELPEPLFKVHIGLYCFKACPIKQHRGFLYEYFGQYQNLHLISVSL